MKILNGYFREQIERSISKNGMLFYYVENFNIKLGTIVSVRVERCYMTNGTIRNNPHGVVYNRTVGKIPVFRATNENT